MAVYTVHGGYNVWDLYKFTQKPYLNKNITYPWKIFENVRFNNGVKVQNLIGVKPEVGDVTGIAFYQSKNITSYYQSLSGQSPNDVVVNGQSQEYTSISTNTSKKLIKTGENQWGLRSMEWDLAKEAADYYLLTLGTIIDPKKYEPYLTAKTEIIVDQFHRYTDMAVGGELRHARNTTNLARPLRIALKDQTISGSRNSAWEGWYWFRQRYGTLALKWAVACFNTPNRYQSGYGGTAWGNIANTLYMYERGHITEHTFIDTCWGLQHNNGTYFNKWWKTHYIKKILDLNQSGYYCQLWPNTTRMVHQLFKKNFIKEHCLCEYCNEGLVA